MALQTIPTHPEADSYVTLIEAEAYFENRSDVADWTALTDDQKEAILKLATRQIDTLRFLYEKVRPTPNWYRDEQKLKYPTIKERSNSGVVDSAGSNYIIDSARANQPTEPDDIWNDGAIIIIDGTGKGQTLKISDFDTATGKITVSADWATNPDTTSQYKIIEAIPSQIKNATCEQALYLTNGGGERQKMQSEGVKSYSIGDLSENFGDAINSLGQVALSNEAKGMMKGLYSIIGKLKI